MPSDNDAKLREFERRLEDVRRGVAHTEGIWAGLAGHDILPRLRDVEKYIDGHEPKIEERWTLSDQRFKDIGIELEVLAKRSRELGEDMSRLKGQIAVYAALGALIGSAVVAFLSQALAG